MVVQEIHGGGSKPLYRAKSIPVKVLSCCYGLTHQQQVRVSAAGLLRRRRGAEGCGIQARVEHGSDGSLSLRGHPDHHICCGKSWQLGSLCFVTPGSLHPLPLWGGQGQGEPLLSPFLLLAEQVVSCLNPTTSQW